MPRRSPTLPKGVWFATKTLAGGVRVRYGYLGRPPGMISLGREGTAEFHGALAEALSKAPPEGTVASLVHSYRLSRAFTELELRTRSDYLRQLDKIKAHFGGLSLRAMAAPTMAEHIERWRDGLGGSARQADYAATVLKLLLAWGLKKGRLTHNRAAGLEKIYSADRSEIRWTDAQLAAFAASASEPLVRAMVLAVETGISQGDLLSLTRAADLGDIVVGRRGKTKVPYAVPVSPALRAALDAAPRCDAIMLLTTVGGRPWTLSGNGFRDAWRLACAAAGVSGVTFNDLRGTFITRRRMMGWSAEETALCSGHPIAGERGAQRSYADRAAIAEANARRLHKAWYGPESERNLQTDLQTAQSRTELSS